MQAAEKAQKEEEIEQLRKQLEVATSSAGGSKDNEGLRDRLEQLELALQRQIEKDKKFLTSENITQDGFDKTVRCHHRLEPFQSWVLKWSRLVSTGDQ